MDHKVLYFRHRQIQTLPRPRCDVRHEGTLYEVVERPGDRVVLASSDALIAYRYMRERNQGQVGQ